MRCTDFYTLGCLTSADLVFMVDSSSSVGSTNFQKLEHFLKDVVSKIDVAPNKVQVGMVKYGSYPSVEFPLGAYKTRAEVNINNYSLDMCFIKYIFFFINDSHKHNEYLLTLLT